MRAELTRVYSPAVTLGEMVFFDEKGTELIKARTIELPDKDNQTGVSCIPEGEYDVSVVGPSEKIKYVHFWIMDVPGRAGIKIHVANYVSQLRGCIAPGKKHADLNADGVIDVSQSTVMLNEMLFVADTQGSGKGTGKTFKLIIRS